MEFTSTTNDVLVRVHVHNAQHTGIGLLKTLHALLQLRQVLSVLRLNRNTHNWRYRELHGANGVGAINGGQGAILDDVLINTNQTHSVTTRNIVNLLNTGTHHQHGTLDVLAEEIQLLAWNIVGTKDVHLLASGNSAREHTTKCKEAAAVHSRNHFGNIKHKRASGVTSTDSIGTFIVKWASV